MKIISVVFDSCGDLWLWLWFRSDATVDPSACLIWAQRPTHHRDSWLLRECHAQALTSVTLGSGVNITIAEDTLLVVRGAIVAGLPLANLRDLRHVSL